MKVGCPRCRRELEFSGDRPSFCAYCGHALGDTRVEATPLLHDAATLVPTSLPPAGPEPIPEFVGGYRLVRSIGKGGMGGVYEAEHAPSGRRVALKLISPEFAVAPEAVERFRQEGRLASGIAHPRCVFVVSADEEAGRPYIVMELMPGDTLADLVRRRGPLPPEQAVVKILDVVEGLQEAHRGGVIHRDVKPSNCFLEADGRVKVGDFGLAKSLVADANLTQTGSFLGTVLYASPEQIRKDPLDAQTDVYSVAATLFFLLTGRAPFHGDDAAATLARIVSEDPPSLREFRPEIPRALDRVVLKGLERQRERRWRTLEEFRAALLPFVPGHLSRGGLGVRIGAFLIDFFALTMIDNLIVLASPLGAWLYDARDPLAFLRLRYQLVLGLLPWLVYFGLLEGVWGATLGKWALRLRVCAAGGGPPGVARASLRALIFFLLQNGGFLAAGIWAFVRYPYQPGAGEFSSQVPHWLLGLVLPWGGLLAGLGIVLAPMRARTGYRGPHEWLTGTRVVRLPWSEARQVDWACAPSFELVRPAGLPERVGPYETLGAVRWGGRERVLMANDPRLGRRVWVWMRPETAPPLARARRESSRAGRLRWLGCGTQDGMQWDAFACQAGCPLPDLVARQGRIAWPDARSCLEQLADELRQAGKDQTLPDLTGVDQVWVQPNGGVQLLDFGLGSKRPEGPEGDAPPEVLPADGPDERRCLGLLADVAVTMLEGRARVPRPAGDGVRAPLPRHAQKLLGRLLHAGGFRRLDGFREALAATRERPAEVNRPRRTVHLLVSGALLSVGVCLMLAVGWGAEAFWFAVSVYQAKAEQSALQAIDDDGAAHTLAVALNGSPWARTASAGVLAEDVGLHDLLEHGAREDEARRTARLEAGGGFLRRFLEGVEWTVRDNMAMSVDLKQPGVWGSAQRVLRERDVIRHELPNVLRRFCVGTILFWPALWVVWAFLWRGGIGYRIAGISLVRSNGRPALRIQCAWRALLVWLPVAGPLALSVWVTEEFWRGWQPGTAVPWWIRWGPWGLWWLAVGVLASYILLALWRPGRLPHDRLAGVYPVPR